MRLPFVLRTTHEMFILQFSTLNQSLRDTISIQQQLLTEKNEQIEALEAFLTSQKCNHYTSEAPKREKGVVLVPSGRSGWRSRALLRSKSTVPPVSDSMEKLNDKVSKEGGKVNV